MSSHSGTIGRTKGMSLTNQMRRQRSVEWQHERNGGYSSSDDDDHRHGAINPSFDSQLLAQLIAQSQELSNKCKLITDLFYLMWWKKYSESDVTMIW